MKQQKKFLFIILLIPLCLMSTQQPLELDTYVSQNFVTIIDNKIKTKNAHIRAINNYFAQFEKRDTPSIVNTTINNAIQPLNNTAINDLMRENAFFGSAIIYFVNCVRLNMKAVTCETIDTIENTLQETPPLNELSHNTLKEFVILNAKEISSFPYNIISTNKYIPNCYDICANTHLAAIGKQKHILDIWDLTTNCLIKQIVSNKSTFVNVSFNYAGSLLATLSTNKKNKSIIALWDLISGGLPKRIKPPRFIYHLKFLQDSDNILAVFEDNQKDRFTCTQTLLSFNKNIMSVLGQLHNQNLPRYQIGLIKNDYIIKDSSSLLTIKKNNNFSFFMCFQAVKNARKNSEFKNLKKTKHYLNLTPFEQSIILDKISAKIISAKKRHIANSDNLI